MTDANLIIPAFKYKQILFEGWLRIAGYENDTVARINVMRTHIERAERTLWLGYLDERDLQKAGEEILYILKFLPNIQPFQTLDIREERSRIQELFTEENAYSLMDHFRIRGEVARMDAAQVIYDKELVATDYARSFLLSSHEYILR